MIFQRYTLELTVFKDMMPKLLEDYLASALEASSSPEGILTAAYFKSYKRWDKKLLHILNLY